MLGFAPLAGLPLGGAQPQQAAAPPAATGTPWTPGFAGGTLLAWFDAKDPLTITQSGGAVSQWSDKAARRHAVQGTGSDQPAYSATGLDGSQPIINADASNDSLNIAAPYIPYNQTSGIMCVAVIRNAGGAGTTRAIAHNLWTLGNGGPSFRLNNADKIEILRSGVASLLTGATAVPQNTPLIVGFDASSSGIKVHLDGVEDGSTASDPAWTIRSIGQLFKGWNNGEVWSGGVAEILFFSTRDATLRQKAEGYLAHKWGTASRLDAGHPYKSAAPTVDQLWTPEHLGSDVFVAGYRLLDSEGENAGAEITVATGVSQWNDWSGNSLNATQGSGSDQAAYSATGLDGTRPIVNADGSNDSLNIPSPYVPWSGADGLTVLAVIKHNGSAANKTIAAPLSDGGPQLRITSTQKLELVRQGQAIIATSTGNVPTTPCLVGWSGDSAGTLLFINGTQDGSTASDPAFTLPIRQLFKGPGGEVLDGGISEVLFLYTKDTATRQRAEGYLAHKWGLETSLPATHPYKDAAPTILWDPNDLPTIANGWFDAQSESTITETGGAVSQWSDKSGTGRHLTNATSTARPVFNETGFRGTHPALVFDGTDDRLFSATFTLPQPFTLVAVAERTPLGTGNKAIVGNADEYTALYTNVVSGSYYTYVYADNNGAYTDTKPNSLIHIAEFNGGSSSLRLDGAAATLVGTVGSGDFNFQPLSVGSWAGTEFHPGPISEVLLIPALISDEIAEKLEGYLAHRWGLTSKLPLAHPFRSAPPEPVVSWTWNRFDKGTPVALSNGDLTATLPAVEDYDEGYVRGPNRILGKKFFRIKHTPDPGGVAGVYHAYGVANDAASLNDLVYSGTSGSSLGATVAIQEGAVSAPFVAVNTTYQIDWGTTPLATNDFVDIAVDEPNGKIWFRRTGSANWNHSGTANPSTNTGGIDLPGGAVYPFFGGRNWAKATAVFADDGLATPPSGFEWLDPTELAVGGPIVIGLTTETDTALASGRAKIKAIGLTTQTTSAFALTKAKRRTITLTTEADTSLALTKSKRKAIGLPTEAATATAAVRLKRRTIAQPVETDTATALLKSKRRAIGLTTEADSATLQTRVKAKAIGLTTSAETAFSTTPRISRTVIVNIPTVTHTAFAFGKAKNRAIGLTTSAGTALSLTPSKRRAIGLATSAETAFAVGKSKRKAISQSVEADTATALVRAKRRTLATAAETTHLALALTKTKRRAIAQASETGLAQPLARSKVRSIALASTAHTATAFTFRRLRTIGLASVSETAFPFSSNLSRFIQIGLTTETGTAQSLARSKRKATSVAATTESATPFTFTRARTIAIGQAPVAESAFSVARSKRLVVTQAAETDTATALARRKVRTFNQTLEADASQPLAKRKLKLIGLGNESDSTLPFTRRRTKTIGQTITTHLAFSFSIPFSGVLQIGLTTDTAFSFGKAKRKSIGLAAGSEAALQARPARARTIGLPVATEAALSLAKAKTKAISFAAEFDFALALPQRLYVPTGPTLETDLALVLRALKSQTIGFAQSTHTAFAVAYLAMTPPAHNPLAYEVLGRGGPLGVDGSGNGHIPVGRAGDGVVIGGTSQGKEIDT